MFSSQVWSSSVDLEIEDAVTEFEFDCIVSDGGIIGIEFGDVICWSTLSDVVNGCWLFVDDGDDTGGLLIFFFKAGHLLVKSCKWR